MNFWLNGRLNGAWFFKNGQDIGLLSDGIPVRGDRLYICPRFPKKNTFLFASRSRKTRHAEALLKEGRDLINAGHPAEAEQRFEELWKSASQWKEYDLAARGMGNAGACQFALYRYQQAARSFIEAHRLAGMAGDRSGAAIFESNLASLYAEMGELESAVEWTERGLRFLAGKDRNEHLAEMLIQLGSLRARQGRLAEGTELFRQGIEIADRQGNLSLYALGWNRFGEELMRRGDHTGAERAFLEAFRVRSLRRFPWRIRTPISGRRSWNRGIWTRHRCCWIARWNLPDSRKAFPLSTCIACGEK